MKENIEIIELKISALPGAHIGDCMKDAIELAAKEWRNVRLRHNGKDYTIKVNDLLGAFTEV